MSTDNFIMSNSSDYLAVYKIYVFTVFVSLQLETATASPYFSFSFEFLSSFISALNSCVLLIAVVLSRYDPLI